MGPTAGGAARPSANRTDGSMGWRDEPSVPPYVHDLVRGRALRPDEVRESLEGGTRQKVD